ncbi:MAG: PAS domain S-box protein [Polynucleobacter sp.]|nr:PAS domain S-box protein [Polynucleobacter sp.]
MHPSLAVPHRGNTTTRRAAAGVRAVMKNVELSMGQGEALAWRIVEVAPDAILLVAADGCIQKVNRRAETLLGYARDELLGQPMEILLSDALREKHRHVLRKAYARQPESRPMGSGRELVARCKDGRLLPVEVSLAPLDLGVGGGVVVTVLRDVTERRRDAALLAVHRVQLETLFLLSPDGLVSFDHEGRVKLVNPAFLRMAGLLAADIVGRPAGELERLLRELAENPEQWPGLDACFAGQEANVGPDETTTGARPSHALTLRRPRGTVLELVGVTSNTASVSRLLYVRDVTREAETDRLKSEFLAHAAHELRTPMASIYGFTELLMTQELDAPTRQDLLATIHKQTQWLVDIINELLDLSRIEARRGKDFRIEAVPLAPLVGETVAAMNIDPVRWPLVVHIPDDLQAARADAAKLRQVLTNVLSNAVKYSPAGGAIDLRCGTREIDGKTFVEIAITDHGIGMTPEQTARVGERFYRADTSGNIPGAGLGMTIAKEIVELHGGEVGIASTPLAGTTVTLWLPAGTPSQAPAPGAPFLVRQPSGV